MVFVYHHAEFQRIRFWVIRESTNIQPFAKEQNAPPAPFKWHAGKAYLVLALVT